MVVALLGDDAIANSLKRSLQRADVTAIEHLTQDELAQRLAGASIDLVICALTAPDHARLLAVEQACMEADVAWVSLHLAGGMGWLGPLVVPGATADYSDLLDRRRCLIDDLALWPAQTTPPTWPAPYLPPRSELDWMLGAFVTEITRWVAGAPCRLLSTEVEADPMTLTLTDHPILPLPSRHLDRPLTSWQPSPERLIDPRTGIVLRTRDTEHHPSIPSALRTVQADVTNMSRSAHAAWQNDLISGGSSFTSASAARMAALGEAVERYCGNWTESVPRLRASYATLAARGERAVDPETLVLYSERQHRQPGFPFERFTRELEVQWVRGRSLTRDTDAWLPASLVYINWNPAGLADEPVVNFHNFAGVQAGPTLEFALASAIEEVVERDAMMTWWSNRNPLTAVALSPDLARHWQGRPAELGQRAWAIHLDNQFDIPVIAGVVENAYEHLLTIGFAARPDPSDATTKAWAEALTLQEGSRDIDRPHGSSAVRALLREQGGDDDSYLKPWRRDRRYLDAYRTDFHDVVQLLCQQQVNLDPRARRTVAPWIDVPASRRIEDLPRLADRELETYRERVERHGFEIFYVDLTTPDIALCGLRVVRVLIPGLAPNFPAAFPTWGRARIQNHAVTLGWTDEPLPEEELNTFPLPYA